MEEHVNNEYNKRIDLKQFFYLVVLDVRNISFFFQSVLIFVIDTALHFTKMSSPSVMCKLEGMSVTSGGAT